MKRLALALMATSALVFGFGIVTSAAGYDPSLTLNPAAPAAGAPYTATYHNCRVGELVTFTQPDSEPTTVSNVLCVAPLIQNIQGSVIGLLAGNGATLGSATAPFTKGPSNNTDAEKTYTVTAAPTGPSPVLTTQFKLPGQTTTSSSTTSPTTTTTLVGATTTVATTGGGAIPSTGSNGTGTTTGIALGLLVVGLGLFVVAQVRRRQEPAAL